MTPLTYTLDQLRDAFQFKDLKTTRKCLMDLVARAGFPPPLPTASLRWSRPAVDHWFAGGTAAQAGSGAPDTTEMIRQLREKQEQAYARAGTANA